MIQSARLRRSDQLLRKVFIGPHRASRFRAVLSLPRNRLPGVQNFPIRTVAGTRVLPSSGRAGACGPGMIVGWVGSGVPTRRKGRFIAVQQHGIAGPGRCGALRPGRRSRSEEHTSELQSHLNLVCRLLLEKKKTAHSGACFVWANIVYLKPGTKEHFMEFR